MRVGAVSGAVRAAILCNIWYAPVQVLRLRLRLGLSFRFRIRSCRSCRRGGGSLRLRLCARGRVEKSGFRLRNLFAFV
eukprot:6896715-Heterocapsa_arctica.AAC.1